MNQTYNEYKYFVSNEKLAYVRNLLYATYGGSDRYPSGIVDSIYYDNLDNHAYSECFNGEPLKRKIRIRGYGDDRFSQLHIKTKKVFQIEKIKRAINPILWSTARTATLNELAPQQSDDSSFYKLMRIIQKTSIYLPVIRIRYLRYRFRVNAYRITLDTNIEVTGFSMGSANRHDYALQPYHVLEVKTPDTRPFLPLLGLVKLPQISFSKFYCGLDLLRTGYKNG